MSKIKEINIKTTDGAWWKLIVDDMYAAPDRFEKDETIVDKILVRFSVPARIWIGDDDIDYLGEQMYINTANITAIEVIRESEECNGHRLLQENQLETGF